MTTGAKVLEMLCAGIEYTIVEDDYDSINWYGKSPAISKAQFEAGFAQYDAWKVQQEAEAAAKKTAAQKKLEALGLSADDLKALGL